MKPAYIANFEHLGFGLFVHFGLYAMLGRGEWVYAALPEEEKKKYFSPEFAEKFNPAPDWADRLCSLAKKAGCKYVTITTKHHDGYCLFDTHGLTDWDCMHYGPHRDLMKEFVDACHKYGLLPIFYHSLMDWHHPDYDGQWPWHPLEGTDRWYSYLDYLSRCVEILCTNYGKIGGMWFDGTWDFKHDKMRDWRLDEFFGMIRRLQPEAMIVNNTGINAKEKLTHYEIDSLTYERNAPAARSFPDGKDRAGESSEVLGEHWGYAIDDFDYKSFQTILDRLVSCRANNCNFLLDVGPDPKGRVKTLDQIYLKNLGTWIRHNKNFIYSAHAADFEAEGATLLQDDKWTYAVVSNVKDSVSPNVDADTTPRVVKLPQDIVVSHATYLDNGDEATIRPGNEIPVKPFLYGYTECDRVIRFKAKKK